MDEVKVECNQMKLTLNGVEVVSRSKDNFINATQLCKAGDKMFKDWYRLDSVKNLIETLESSLSLIGHLCPIRNQPVVEVKSGRYGCAWIHPKLAVHLASWLSPVFALQVSDWVIQLLTTGNVSITEVQKKLTETQAALEQEKIISHQKQLALQKEREERQKMESKVLRMEDFYETQRRRLQKKEIIYIGTSNAYQSQNRFKVGGCSSKNVLKSRFAHLNTGRAADDIFYCVHFWEVHSHTLVEKTIKTVLSSYQDSGEVYHIHGKSLMDAIQFIINNASESIEWFNSHFNEFNQATLNDEPSRFPSITFPKTLSITAGSRNMDLVDITDWPEEKVDEEIERILNLYQQSKQTSDPFVWGEISKIIKDRHKGTKMMEWRGAFRQFIPKRSVRLQIKGLKLDP